MATSARHDSDYGLPGGIGAAVADLERGFRSAVAGLTAHAGGGQASATPLTAAINVVSTVATAGDSVVLPAAKAGATAIVKNISANSMDVFPLGATDVINALAVQTAYAVATVKSVMFFCAVDGVWETILTA